MTGLPTGRYVPGRSPLHGLDARAKLICFILLLAALLGASSLPGYLLAFGCLAALLALSRLPPAHTLGPLARLWLFFLVILGMNALFYGGGAALWGLAWLRPSLTGLRQGLRVAVRVALVVVCGNLLTATTPPMELTAGMERLLKPLARLRLPVEDAAMVVGAAVQFIPTLLEEASLLKSAQTARGARFESRKPLERAASFPPLAAPLFFSAFRRADELATAMEARGYRGARGRTGREKLPLRKGDFCAMALCLFICLIQLLFL